MRILYVVTAAEFGGSVVHVLQLAEQMMNEGHAVAVVGAQEPRFLKEAHSIGVRTMGSPHFVRRISPWNDLRALLFVGQAIRQFKPDLVSAHSTKAGYAVRIACTVPHKRSVFTAHGWSFTEGKSLWTRRLLVWAERMLAKVTDRIICVSNHDRDLALEHRVVDSKKLVVVHNGMDPQPYLSADGHGVRREMALGEEVLITMIGRLVPQKDPSTLLEAAAALRGHVRVALVGGGERQGQVEEFIWKRALNQRVSLLGERSDVPAILAASSVFVLSTNWEGLPRSIIEAMMAGLPVVATNVGGVPELVEDGVTGILIPRNDPGAMTHALQRLIDNPELRRRMGEAGREKALRDFTLDRMLMETEKVYDEVLGGESSSGARD